MGRRRIVLTVRDSDGELLAMLDRVVARDRNRYPGRRVTREGTAREVLFRGLQRMAGRASQD